MSEIVERAAKALCTRLPGVSPSDCLHGKLGRSPCNYDNCLAVEIATIALLAALDPEDETLVEAMARHTCLASGFDPNAVVDMAVSDGRAEFNWHRWRASAWRFLSALRSIISDMPTPEPAEQNSKGE